MRKCPEMLFLVKYPRYLLVVIGKWIQEIGDWALSQCAVGGLYERMLYV